MASMKSGREGEPTDAVGVCDVQQECSSTCDVFPHDGFDDRVLKKETSTRYPHPKSWICY